jgi:acetyl esterase/lipase
MRSSFLTRLAPALAILLSACSPLRTFNAVVPKDPGAVRIAQDQSFRAGPRGSLDLYAPRGTRADARLPVIVFLYGGSWNSGEKGSYSFAGYALARRGFLVAIPDYRLYPEVRYPAFIEDGAAAVRWLRANAGRFGGDPDRLVLVGHSAGAYNAAMLALDPQWLGRDRAAIRGWAGMGGPYSFLPLDSPATIAAFGGTADLPATQPTAFVSANSPPALLITGAKDTLVRPRNAERMAAAYAAAGAPVETRVYPDVGHAGLVTALSTLLRRKAPALDDVTAFAQRVTAPRP